MKLHLQKQQLIVFLFGLLIQMGLSLVFAKEFFTLGEKWEFYGAVISVYILAFALFIWIKFKFTYLSPVFLFFIASYLLHLALVVLVGFHLKEFRVLRNVVLYSYSERDCAVACFYCCWFLFIYIASYLLMSGSENLHISRNKKLLSMENDFELKKAGVAGYSLLFLSAPAMLYNSMLQIQVRLSGAYSKIYSVDSSFHGVPLGPMMNLFLPAVFFILYSYIKSKKKFIAVAISISLYYILYMILSGAKIHSLVTILAILVMYNHYFGLKLSPKIIVFGYLAMKVIVAVTSMRSDTGLGETGGVWAQFVEGFLNKDPIIELLAELGGTILTVTLVMLSIRTGGDYLYGQSYLFGPVGSILKGLRISDYFSDKADMYVYLTDPARGSYINGKTYAMGGSAIGEWFLNFGWAGLLLVPLLVWLIMKLQRALLDDSENAFRKVMCYCFLVLFIMYSRQYITDLFWITFYRCVTCYILLKLLSGTSLQKKVLLYAIKQDQEWKET